MGSTTNGSNRSRWRRSLGAALRLRSTRRAWTCCLRNSRAASIADIPSAPTILFFGFLFRPGGPGSDLADWHWPAPRKERLPLSMQAADPQSLSRSRPVRSASPSEPGRLGYGFAAALAPAGAALAALALHFALP